MIYFFFFLAATLALVPNKPLAAALLKPLSKKLETEPSSSFFFLSAILKPFLIFLKLIIALTLIFFILIYNPKPIIYYIKQRITGQPVCPDPYGVCKEAKQ